MSETRTMRWFPRRTRLVPLWTALIFFMGAGGMITGFTFFLSRPVEYTFFLPTEPKATGYVVSGSLTALENSRFFEEAKAKLIAERASFIESDLSAMTLRVYQDGAVVKEASILSKGKEGSWWETPAGVYKIEAKEKKHFSSFGRVYMPWSLHFQGNFFIHGWPHYPNGTPVPQGYSGGCIRLSSDDAKEIYELAGRGMPVVVFEKDFGNDGFVYEPKIARIEAESYLVADLRSNFVFAEKGSRDPYPIASLSKLMTAVVATEHVDIEKKITIEEAALVQTLVPRVEAGERYSLYDLLHPLLIESSNEAAEAIAQSIGRSRFLELMNQKAVAIGMKETRFKDASGLDALDTSSAEDLFALAKYLYNNRRFILNITSGKVNDTVYGLPRFRHLQNFNVLVDHPDFVGGKVGETIAAKQTGMAVLELDVGGARRPVALILLGSKNIGEEATRIVRWLKDNY